MSLPKRTMRCSVSPWLTSTSTMRSWRRRRSRYPWSLWTQAIPFRQSRKVRLRALFCFIHGTFLSAMKLLMPEFLKSLIKKHNEVPRQASTFYCCTRASTHGCPTLCRSKVRPAGTANLMFINVFCAFIIFNHCSICRTV